MSNSTAATPGRAAFAVRSGGWDWIASAAGYSSKRRSHCALAYAVISSSGSAHGDKTHLARLVRHRSTTTLAQIEVVTEQNEITAAPTLLRDRDLHGTVTTGDALLTQQTQA